MTEKNSDQLSAISFRKTSFQPSALNPRFSSKEEPSKVPINRCRIVCDETSEDFRFTLCRILCAGACPRVQEFLDGNSCESAADFPES